MLSFLSNFIEQTSTISRIIKENVQKVAKCPRIGRKNRAEQHFFTGYLPLNDPLLSNDFELLCQAHAWTD